MTKPVTSLAVLILVDRGLLPLETPLDAILPASRYPTALIAGAEHLGQTQACKTPTILQLLVTMQPDKGSLDQQIKALSRIPLAFAPGQKWEY